MMDSAGLRRGDVDATPPIPAPLPEKPPDAAHPAVRPAPPCVTHMLYSGLGGHASVLFGLLDAGFLRGARHRVVFFGVEKPPTFYLDQCAARGVAWQYVPKHAGRRHAAFFWQLRQVLLQDRPDILFLHGLSAMPAVLLARTLPPRLKAATLLRETQANHLKSRSEWFSLVLAHWFADCVVHLSREALEGTRQRLGRLFRQQRTHVVPNGIDTDYFSPGARFPSTSDGVLRVGMQSRLQENKDHGTLLEAFARVAREEHTAPLELHIAGEGATYDRIVRRATELGISQKLVMHGLLAPDALRAFLRSLDAYVHCTHGETMSTAIMQALACGLPVIASDVGGVSNMVTPEAGLLHRPGDPGHLASQLQRLLRDPRERALWAERARAAALSRYGIAVTVRAYEELITRTLLVQRAETPA